MAEILLFHHAQGRTPGVRAFAETLRAAGHAVHVPDLYDGATFDDLDAGVVHAERRSASTRSPAAVRRPPTPYPTGSSTPGSRSAR